MVHGKGLGTNVHLKDQVVSACNWPTILPFKCTHYPLPIFLLGARTIVCFVWQVVLHQASAAICFYDLKICWKALDAFHFTNGISHHNPFQWSQYRAKGGMKMPPPLYTNSCVISKNCMICSSQQWPLHMLHTQQAGRTWFAWSSPT
jgi:hypothetical protein